MLRAALVVLSLVLTLPSALTAQDGAPTTSASDMTVNPGDVIQVVIYREPELNGEFIVGEDGTAVLPLIGEQRVSGIGIRDLRLRLIELYREYLRNPSINVIPLRRVTILGEVNRPGMYNIDPTVSLAGAVATAGGVTSSGDINRIRIMRQGETSAEPVQNATTVQAAGIHSGDVVFVGRRSWFERHTTFIVSTLLSVTSIVITILRR